MIEGILFILFITLLDYEIEKEKYEHEYKENIMNEIENQMVIGNYYDFVEEAEEDNLRRQWEDDRYDDYRNEIGE